MSFLETRVLSHRQRVCRLYKQSLKTLRDHYDLYYLWRYHAVVLRARFDANKDVIDMIKAKQLLMAGERECHKYRHPQPLIFPSSPGGVAYERYPAIDDVILDFWHPLEKMQYPTYFSTREKRKKEYIKLYNEKYGPVHIATEDGH
ncbi:unnamed protein product [Gordionus sp. m RMFG-2023]|uniref:NADH dehydrogenase [ubiquinone] 1 beta subcomplex subunit 9-like n=1 Tax=Gordionus sp. m RMFG-2023 TaxID=3053472 RepID=UPI0030DE12C2